jgi:hypothetical protein
MQVLMSRWFPSLFFVTLGSVKLDEEDPCYNLHYYQTIFQPSTELHEHSESEQTD